MAEDIVQVFARIAQEMQPRTVDDWRRVTLRIRQEWGGTRVYVAKAPAEGKTWRLAESLAAGVAIREAFERCDVTPRTGYRLIRRRWR